MVKNFKIVYVFINCCKECISLYFCLKRFKSKAIIKQSKSRIRITDKKNRVYIIDLSDILAIRYDLAVKYTLIHQEQKMFAEKKLVSTFNESRNRGDVSRVKQKNYYFKLSMMVFLIGLGNLRFYNGTAFRKNFA